METINVTILQVRINIRPKDGQTVNAGGYDNASMWSANSFSMRLPTVGGIFMDYGSNHFLQFNWAIPSKWSTKFCHSFHCSLSRISKVDSCRRRIFLKIQASTICRIELAFYKNHVKSQWVDGLGSEYRPLLNSAPLKTHAYTPCLVLSMNLKFLNFLIVRPICLIGGRNATSRQLWVLIFASDGSRYNVIPK